MGVGTTHSNTGKQREQEYWGLGIKQNQELSTLDRPVLRCPLYHQIKMSFGG